MNIFSAKIILHKFFFITVFLITFFASAVVNAQCIYFKKVITAENSSHCFGIKTDGTLWAWGNDTYGQLGDGNSNTVIGEPEQVGTATNWIALATGNAHSLGITADGKLWAWGLGDEGQLGDGLGIGTPHNVLTPQQVMFSADSNWIAVSASDNHSFGITADGKLWGWGYATFLGNPSGNPSDVPIQISSDSNWVAVSTGHLHTIALKKDSTLWGWGRNGEGEAGDSTTTNNIYTPEEIDSSHSWVTISAGYDHTLALKKDGSLWAWGGNNEGAVGDGTTINGTHGPQRIGTKTWVAVAGGLYHSLAIASDGRRWAWGNNSLGEFGNDSAGTGYVGNDILTPALTDSSNNWAAVYGGYEFSLNQVTDGSVWASGDNGSEELGDGTNTRRFTLVKVGTPVVYPALATSGGTDTEYQRGFSYYATDCSNLITEIFKSGGNPIHATTAATAWIDNSVKTDGSNKPYVQRHYEISPASHDSTATGTVILYFTQAEFTAYNAFSKVADGTYPKLPIDATDAAGYRSNLKLTKINSTSSDGSGDFSTYSGTTTLITPTSVVYQNGSWSVSFATTGFGGYFATTGSTTLPITWLNLTATLNSQKHAQINWKVQEQNVALYEIEKSPDGKNFNLLAAEASKGNGLNTYEFTEVQVAVGNAFYRIKQTDRDSKFSYSNIVHLNGDSQTLSLSLSPNPANDHLYINGLGDNKTYHVFVTDMLGNTILTKEINSGQNEIYTNTFVRGVYLVKIITDTSITGLKFVKE